MTIQNDIIFADKRFYTPHVELKNTYTNFYRKDRMFVTNKLIEDTKRKV